MVVYNSNEKESSITTQRFAERIKTAKQAQNVVTGEKVDLSKITIPAKTTFVLELLP
jgi:hypothetical protein